MQWYDHHLLEGKHAFLGGSQYHWLNWPDEDLEGKYYSHFSTDMGTALHSLASDCIRSRTKLNKSDRHLIDLTLYKASIPTSALNTEEILINLMQFVNDAIGFHLSSEVILYYSPECFGTADAIGFDERNNILRIHDYKSGLTPAHMEQLMIYAALFCLEYHKKPGDMKLISLKLYQNCEIREYVPQSGEIETIMNMIIDKCNKIEMFKERDRR